MDLWANTLRPTLDHFRLFSVTLLPLSLPPSLSLPLPLHFSPLQIHIFTFYWNVTHRTIPSGQLVYFISRLVIQKSEKHSHTAQKQGRCCPTHLRWQRVSAHPQIINLYTITMFCVFCFEICTPSPFSPSPLWSANLKTKQAQNLSHQNIFYRCMWDWYLSHENSAWTAL